VPVLQPGARQQLAQVAIAGAVLRQQQQSKRAVAIGVVRDPQIAADDRLDAAAARGGVEAHRSEQVAQIGQRQRALLVARGRVHRFVDPHQAVDDRELGVQAQMNEAGRHTEHFIDAGGSGGCVLNPERRRLSDALRSADL